jgi:HEPN domain-containing protein
LSDTPKTYPGDLATPADVLRLASEYRNAAKCLFELGRRRDDPQSHAPCRLAAIHAVELYLSALLLYHGHSALEIRSLQHDLSERTRLAKQGGLRLKKKTEANLLAIMENREYLVVRYGPEEMTGTGSPISRLMATLNEVDKKVTAKITASDLAKLSKVG